MATKTQECDGGDEVAGSVSAVVAVAVQTLRLRRPMFVQQIRFESVALDLSKTTNSRVGAPPLSISLGERDCPIKNVDVVPPTSLTSSHSKAAIVTRWLDVYHLKCPTHDANRMDR